MADTYRPDRWVILDTGASIKVFATWLGGYTQGESWKLSSGNIDFIETDYSYILAQYSGSVYILHKECEGTSLWTSSVLAGFLTEDAKKLGVRIVSPQEAKELVIQYKQ